MAEIIFRDGADVESAIEEMRKKGLTVRRRKDGKVFAFYSRKQYLLLQHPELEWVFNEDREFWKAVRRRSRNGEDTPKEAIEAHVKWFKEMLRDVDC